MSWITRINNIALTIVTGDGKEYQPLWKEAKKNLNFNTEAFDFINIRGTFVERKELQGAQYPILLYFTGEDCIDKLQEFEESSSDKRPWTIKHPYYDDIIVQPLSLEFDNSIHNVSKVTGVLWETLTVKYPDDIISPEREVIVRKSAADETVAATFTDNIETPAAESIEPAQTSITQLGVRYQSIELSVDEVQILKDLLRTASAAATELISAPNAYIQETINLINFPFIIEQNIEQKINALLGSIEDLATIFITDDITDDDKILYENQASVIFTELSRNILQSDETEYETRNIVITVVENINNAYAQFLVNLDENDITQDKQVSIDLDYIVNLALAKLYDLAFDAKQERLILLEKDSNLINLAHKYYGPGDDNINLFIAQNKIGLHEYITVKKGREILYYV